jgi:5-(carboxyamino)imidazole ribonucleotide mutase
MAEHDTAARVGIVCGSRSDFPVMEKAAELLGKLEVACEIHAISAHRAPDLLSRFVVAAKTILPVIGVPIATQVERAAWTRCCRSCRCRRECPVATVAVGGAENAALLAAEILALSDPASAGQACWPIRDAHDPGDRGRRVQRRSPCASADLHPPAR